MSLDVYLTDENGDEVYWANITHNLTGMAAEAGIYKHLWRPDEIGITKAAQLIEPVSAGLALMVSEPSRFHAFDASNGWGTYRDFIPFVAEYVEACRKHPNADVRVSR